jgi:hypothetical protein
VLLSKDRAASRNEKSVITIWGIETLLVKRGVYILLHYGRNKWYSRVQAGDRGNLKCEEGGWYGGGKLSSMRGGGEQIVYIF